MPRRAGRFRWRVVARASTVSHDRPTRCLSLVTPVDNNNSIADAERRLLVAKSTTLSSWIVSRSFALENRTSTVRRRHGNDGRLAARTLRLLRQLRNLHHHLFRAMFHGREERRIGRQELPPVRLSEHARPVRDLLQREGARRSPPTEGHWRESTHN